MIHDRPPRLAPQVYLGRHRYHVRTSTWNRARHFETADTTAWVLEQLLQRLDPFRFAMFAYCFMPDHVHLLLESQSNDASLIGLISRWKQTTGFRFKHAHGVRLCQSSFFDRVLREDESSVSVAAYILSNPVRASLAATVGEYPFAWCAWGNNVGTDARG